MRSSPGAVIVEFRKSSGRTQQYVARELGITPRHLRNVEAGRGGLSETASRRLACLLESEGQHRLATMVRISTLDLLSLDRRMERIERRIALLEGRHHSEVA